MVKRAAAPDSPIGPYISLSDGQIHRHLESLGLIVASLSTYTASAMIFSRKSTNHHTDKHPNATRTSSPKHKPNIPLIVTIIVVVVIIMAVWLIWQRGLITKMLEKRKRRAQLDDREQTRAGIRERTEELHREAARAWEPIRSTPQGTEAR